MSTAVTENARERQGELGQFFTATPVAEFMASLFKRPPATIRLLDAGAGAGALTKAFVARFCHKHEGVHAIEATLYEVDPLILETLSETMKECRRLCSLAGIHFTFGIHRADFIQEMSVRLSDSLFESPPPSFDVAITNPPYRKISSESSERLALRSVGIETGNLYTGFVALIHRLLVPGGQLVGITPRSFCNGPYFRPFREDFLGSLEIRQIHVFESREAVFRDDAVLQENIIFHAVKGQNQSPMVTISSSSGEVGGAVVEKILPFTEVVHPRDAEKFIHIPSMVGHASSKKAMSGLTTTLADLGITVSTGRVVDFRLKAALCKEPGPGTVPLLYPCHFNGGTVHWPRLEARKPNAILDNEATRPWLVPAGIYVLTKRFTSKEEKRRIVACLFDPDEVSAERLGFENHLNYFHANGQGLNRSLAKGLFLFLNSTIVDQYFRRFSGHTQVNATDLRALKYPKREALFAMGGEIKSLLLTQKEIDQVVIEHLHVS